MTNETGNSIFHFTSQHFWYSKRIWRVYPPFLLVLVDETMKYFKSSRDILDINNRARSTAGNDHRVETLPWKSIGKVGKVVVASTLMNGRSDSAIFVLWRGSLISPIVRVRTTDRACNGGYHRETDAIIYGISQGCSIRALEHAPKRSEAKSIGAFVPIPTVADWKLTLTIPLGSTSIPDIR